jgi:hypothetical protein
MGIYSEDTPGMVNKNTSIMNWISPLIRLFFIHLLLGGGGDPKGNVLT